MRRKEGSLQSPLVREDRRRCSAPAGDNHSATFSRAGPQCSTALTRAAGPERQTGLGTCEAARLQLWLQHGGPLEGLELSFVSSCTNSRKQDDDISLYFCQSATGGQRKQSKDIERAGSCSRVANCGTIVAPSQHSVRTWRTRPSRELATPLPLPRLDGLLSPRLYRATGLKESRGLHAPHTRRTQGMDAVEV